MLDPLIRYAKMKYSPRGYEALRFNGSTTAVNNAVEFDVSNKQLYRGHRW